MEKVSNKIKYFLYARKSSEGEDRQVQSIEDQINRLKRLAFELKLDISEIFTESKSAKMPNNRPVFENMMQQIEAGGANGILCWQINRLSRNPIDSGKISWLLQQGVLKSIQSIDKQYLPEDNVLLFSMESGVANQYILDLSKNVKRGIRSKFEKGWLTGVAPLGYLNDKENKIIIKDPERFNLIRKMWDLMLTGSYTPPRILNIANNDWGFRTRKFKRLGNKELSRSGIYKIFTNLFYAGIIENNGIQYKGKHESMVTLEDFDTVQVILGRKGKPRPKSHVFAYTGLIRCSECGCLYTAETKKKLIKKTGEVKEYTYYHCTRKTKKVNCTQKKCISVDALELQVKKELTKYTILPDFLTWALETLNSQNAEEFANRSKIYEMLHCTLAQTQAELNELTKMRYRQLIDDTAFLKEKNALQSKIDHIMGQLNGGETVSEKYRELTEKAFYFATYALTSFMKAKGIEGLELKRRIIMTLGKKLIFIDGKLTIDPDAWLVPIKNHHLALEAKFKGLELDKMPINTEQKEVLDSIRTQWRGVVDDVRTIIENTEGKIKIPDFSQLKDTWEAA
jgi:site-specific DNA recombinase